MSAPQFLTNLFQPWSDLYSHSKALNAVVNFAHIGGLLLGGGFAIAADRGTFRAMRYPADERRHHMADLASVHKWVITGLAIVAVSGLFQLAADLDTFFGSWIFWTKMALVLILLINGYLMTRTEARLAIDSSESSPAWPALHRAAVLSMILWFVTTLAGAVLLNLA